MADENSLLSSDELKKALEEFNISGDSEEEKVEEVVEKKEDISTSDIYETVETTKPKEKVVEESKEEDKVNNDIKEDVSLDSSSNDKKKIFKDNFTKLNIRKISLVLFILLLIVLLFLSIFTDLFRLSKKKVKVNQDKPHKVLVESKKKIDNKKTDNIFVTPPLESDLLKLSEEKSAFIEQGVALFVKDGLKDFEKHIAQSHKLHSKFKSSLNLDDFLTAFSYDLSAFLCLSSSESDSRNYFSSQKLGERMYPVFYFWDIDDDTRDKIIYLWSKKVREILSLHLK